MHAKKLSSITDRELFEACGKTKKDFDEIVFINDDVCDNFLLMPSAYDDFIKSGKVITSAVEKSILDIIHHYENEMSSDVRLGQIEEKNGRKKILTLKITFLSNSIPVKACPSIYCVGINIDSIILSNDINNRSWMKKLYFDFLRGYFVACKSMRENTYWDIIRKIDAQKEDGVVLGINMLLDWYEKKYKKSFLSTKEVNKTYATVIGIVRDFFERWSSELCHYVDSKEDSCCVAITSFVCDDRELIYKGMKYMTDTTIINQFKFFENNSINILLKAAGIYNQPQNNDVSGQVAINGYNNFKNDDVLEKFYSCDETNEMENDINDDIPKPIELSDESDSLIQEVNKLEKNFELDSELFNFNPEDIEF